MMGEEKQSSRRELLKTVGALTGMAAAGSITSYIADNTYPDADGDGIDDRWERSDYFHDYLESTFQQPVEYLDPDQKNFLIDVRYVGDARLRGWTPVWLENTFEEHGIYAQVLEHPETYDKDWFVENWGYNDLNILGPVNSFYDQVVEEPLKNAAVQLIVLPSDDNRELETIVMTARDAVGGANDERGEDAPRLGGVSYGNRAAVLAQDYIGDEQRLVLHELGHTVLCHDYGNPENNGVMGSGEQIDFTDEEWEQFRNGLPNIHDTTGADTIVRPCVWEDFIEDIV